MKTCRRRFLTRSCATVLALRRTPARGDEAAWPAVTRIVLPSSPGGGVDLMVRTLGNSLAASLATSVVIDYKPGAAGLLAAQAVASAAPDGATILLMHSGHVTLQALARRPSILDTLEPVSRISTSPHVLAVPTGTAHETLLALLSAIAKQPGAVNFGSGGVGSPSHLVFERMAEQWPGGLSVTHVPFKSPSEAVTALSARQIDFCFALQASVQPYIDSGRVRALAITSAARAPQFPDLPTAAEGGLAGFVDEPWFGFALPAKTLPALAERLTSATRTAVTAPEFKALLFRTGGTASYSASPAEFAAQVRVELQADAALLTRLGIKRE